MVVVVDVVLEREEGVLVVPVASDALLIKTPPGNENNPLGWLRTRTTQQVLLLTSSRAFCTAHRHGFGEGGAETGETRH